MLGIPVEYVPDLRVISETTGVGPWKRILVGNAFFDLEPRLQGAILLHEAGHAKLRHLEKRIWFAIRNFWRPMAIGSYCRNQEFEADQFAANCGYGRDLALVFARVDAPAGPYHPNRLERIARLALVPPPVVDLTRGERKG